MTHQLRERCHACDSSPLRWAMECLNPTNSVKPSNEVARPAYRLSVMWTRCAIEAVELSPASPTASRSRHAMWYRITRESPPMSYRRRDLHPHLSFHLQDERHNLCMAPQSPSGLFRLAPLAPPRSAIGIHEQVSAWSWMM